MTFLVLKLSPCRRSRHPQTWPGTVIWCLSLKLRIAQYSELILAELITIWSPANLNLIMGAGSCKFKQDTTHCPECLSCLFTAILSLLYALYKLQLHLLEYSANGARNKAGDNKNSFVPVRPKHLLTAINKWLQLEMYWQQRRRQFQLSTCNGDKTGPGAWSLTMSLPCPLQCAL